VRVGFASRRTSGATSCCLSFFGVAGGEEGRALLGKPEAYFDNPLFRFANLGATAAWLRKGEIEAQKLDKQSFRGGLLHGALRNTARLHTPKEPAEFVPVLRERCSQAGRRGSVSATTAASLLYGAHSMALPQR